VHGQSVPVRVAAVRLVAARVVRRKLGLTLVSSANESHQNQRHTVYQKRQEYHEVELPPFSIAPRQLIPIVSKEDDAFSSVDPPSFPRFLVDPAEKSTAHDTSPRARMCLCPYCNKTSKKLTKSYQHLNFPASKNRQRRFSLPTASPSVFPSSPSRGGCPPNNNIRKHLSYPRQT